MPRMTLICFLFVYSGLVFGLAATLCEIPHTFVQLFNAQNDLNFFLCCSGLVVGVAATLCEISHIFAKLFNAKNDLIALCISLRFGFWSRCDLVRNFTHLGKAVQFQEWPSVASFVAQVWFLESLRLVRFRARSPRLQEPNLSKNGNTIRSFWEWNSFTKMCEMLHKVAATPNTKPEQTRKRNEVILVIEQLY